MIIQLIKICLANKPYFKIMFFFGTQIKMKMSSLHIYNYKNDSNNLTFTMFITYYSIFFIWLSLNQQTSRDQRPGSPSQLPYTNLRCYNPFPQTTRVLSIFIGHEVPKRKITELSMWKKWLCLLDYRYHLLHLGLIYYRVSQFGKVFITWILFGVHVLEYVHYLWIFLTFLCDW